MKRIHLRRNNRKTPFHIKLVSLKLALLLTLGSMLALGYIHLKVNEIKLGYDISASKKIESELRNKNNIIHAKYMKFKSPTRIGKIASDLGFKFPTLEDVIYIDQATVVGEKHE